MANNAQKTPLTRTLNRLAQKHALDAIALTGKSLPCTVAAVSGSIVTVNFEVTSVYTLPQVTMPLFGPEYIRYPIQKGDKGYAMAADAYLGGMSGLGGGAADLSLPANLSALVFMPIGNKIWSEVDPNAVTIYGPNGVVARDTQSATVCTLTPTGWTLDVSNGSAAVTASASISFSAGGHSIVISSDGVVIDGVAFLPHTHSGVTTGSGDSGPVVT